MRTPHSLPFALVAALVAAAPAQAQPYALLGVSAVEGLTMVDVASLRTVDGRPRAWAYVVLPERPPQRVFLEASEIEFDCPHKRTRMVSGVRYGLAEKVVARTAKPDPWRPVPANSPAAAMLRQACAGAFDPERLRGQGKTVHQYAAEMRPLLARMGK